MKTASSCYERANTRTDDKANKKIRPIKASTPTVTSMEVDWNPSTACQSTEDINGSLSDSLVRNSDSEPLKVLCAATEGEVTSLTPASTSVQVVELLGPEAEGSSISGQVTDRQNPENEGGTISEHDNEGITKVTAEKEEEGEESEPEFMDAFDVHRKKQYRTVLQNLKELLESREDLVLTSENVTNCQQMIQILAEKYKKKHEDTKTWTSRVHVKHPSQPKEFIKRIGGSAEKERKWMGSLEEREKEIPAMLMRAWDQISQCQIKDHRVGFLSGGSINKLNTSEDRKLALTQHADWKTRTGTAFISFSSSLREIGLSRVPHFNKRQARKAIRTNTKLTLINTRAILAAGKPILRMKDELIHYKVKTREGQLADRTDSWYEYEYIAPFCVGPEAIVTTWSVPRWRNGSRTRNRIGMGGAETLVF